MSHRHHHHEKEHHPDKKESDFEHIEKNRQKHEVPPSEAVKPASKQASINEEELDNLKKELHEYKDKYLRTLAESENARKRLGKEKQEMIQYALQNSILDFLNPIDHMENALSYSEQMSEEVKHWAVGFQMILTQFKDALSNQGVQPFVSVGKHFDPHLHEAIEMIETDEYPPGTVIQESLKGYKMGERIIRPARVKVSKQPQNEKQENNLKQEINGVEEEV